MKKAKNSKFKILNSKFLSSLEGFTLVEMIVAVTVFVIAIMIAAGLFVTIVRAQAKTTAQRLVNQEARYVMETINREARLAMGSSSAPAIGVSGNTLTLTSGTSSKTFTLSSERIQMGSSFLTSNNVRVTQFTLSNYLSASDYTPPATPTRQPSVTITITVESGGGPTSPRGAQIILRTTISSRDYDYSN